VLNALRKIAKATTIGWTFADLARWNIRRLRTSFSARVPVLNSSESSTLTLRYLYRKQGTLRSNTHAKWNWPLCSGTCYA
jgi:hypothetical protein